MGDEHRDPPEPGASSPSHGKDHAKTPEPSRIQPDRTPVRERSDNLRRRGEWFRKRRGDADKDR